MGQRLSDLSRKLSAVLVRVDGIDQAKFRVPRVLQKAHAFDRLVRPALHIQGIWAHCFGFHFAVADADMHKNTNNNVEVLARMLDSVHQKLGGLPRTVTLIQDNTARECKNSKILKFFIKLKALDILDHAHLGYPEKGHTHGPLDATYGQCCVKIANSEFQDPSEVVDILQGFLDEAALDPGTSQNKQAYKLDESADWEAWWDEVDLRMSQLTGPEAPHWFHICSRKDLSLGPSLTAGVCIELGNLSGHGCDIHSRRCLAALLLPRFRRNGGSADMLAWRSSPWPRGRGGGSVRPHGQLEAAPGGAVNPWR